MRSIITTIATMLLMMTASIAIAADDQVTVSIDHEPSPHITERIGDTNGFIRTSLEGHFLWVLYGRESGDWDAYTESVSIDVSDPTITGAVIFDDGTVTLLRDESTDEGSETEVDLVEEFPEITPNVRPFYDDPGIRLE